MVTFLAATAIIPAVATLYFFLFWTWFDYWRKRIYETYAMMLGAFGGATVAVALLHRPLLARAVAMPGWLRAAGWALFGLALLLGTVADRQIGFRVRSFMPFFDRRGRLELVTTGAYGVVRHPIYAAGLYYQVGLFLATGYAAIAVAAAVFGLGALWFTRQEERRLVTLLDDPSAYERYRARVPALVPYRLLSRRR